MAIKKAAKTTAIAKWDEKFAGYAKQATKQVENVGAGGTSVKFGRGSISVGGTAVPGGRLTCIVLGSCALNAWYEGKYDPNEITPPTCYAFAEEAGDPDMKPHKDCEKPQSPVCADCDKNQFGTAEVGRGKACGNNIRLGLLLSKDVEDGDTAAHAELANAKVSPTNLKYWAGYVKMLEEEYQRPPWAVVTQIQTFDDPKTQIRVEFTFVEKIDDDDILTALEKRYDGVQKQLQTPFLVQVAAPVKPKAGASGKFAGKAVGKAAGKRK